MQPYFFPYIGYFQLINAVDKFVIFDAVQYIKHGWMNRNRILSPNLDQEWQYIIVPLRRFHQTDKISNIIINNDQNWPDNIYGKLSYYKKIRAPYFEDVINLLTKALDIRYNTLTALNISTLEAVCDYLNIDFNHSLCSQNNYDLRNVIDKGDWALEISKIEKAKTYINPIGGIELFDKNNFLKENIDLKFLNTKEIIYQQSKRKFVPNLSIIDVLMFNSKDQVKEILLAYDLR